MAQRLRFEVFNLELNEGLPSAALTGLDADAFDGVCDHLVVWHVPAAEVVGTYRLQTGSSAAARIGYYSEQEFDLSCFEPLREELIELGRACVRRDHRNLAVLGLLWKGIADYAAQRGARYLIGCSSLTSQDPAVGASAYSQLCRRYQTPPRLRTVPQPGWGCPLGQLCETPPDLPKLLRAYLTLGARVCGPPALDREFKTIDFLMFLDFVALTPEVRARFFGEA
jgi:putative hemolysin